MVHAQPLWVYEGDKDQIIPLALEREPLVMTPYYPYSILSYIDVS